MLKLFISVILVVMASAQLHAQEAEQAAAKDALKNIKDA